MNESQIITETSAPPSAKDFANFCRELSSTASALQSIVDQQENIPVDSIRAIPSVLKQALETMNELYDRLLRSETKLKDAQQIIQGVNEFETLLDILPVGIIIAHDPQNLDMTINRAGLAMLNMAQDMNPSKSAPGGENLPFKVFRDGRELLADDLPMQYATSHRVALHDIELEVRHTSGKVIDLLEYASPLYDEKGLVSGSLGVLVDITSRKAVEQRLMMQYTIARVLAESNSINEAAMQVLSLICNTAGWEYGALWRVEPDTQTLTNEGVWYADYVNLSKYAEATRYSTQNGEAANLPGYVFHTGQPLWLSTLEDFQSEDALNARQAGLSSAFILPVRSSDKVIAILECMSNRRQTQDQNLTAMLNAVGNQIGIFLERKLLEEALAVRANQQQILAQTGIALSASIDYEKRLLNVVKVIVPDLADWCAIDMIDQNNILRRVAAAHVDPTKVDLVYKIQPTREVDPDKTGNNVQVETLRTGKSLVFTEIPFSLIESTVADPEMIEIFHQLDPRSSIVVPLIAHGRILGMCSLVQSDSRRRYLPADLSLVEDIGQRVALALDNAILFAESQKLNTKLENRVDDRTNQLKVAINQLTNQIVERQNAEEQVRILNAELEKRISERTGQLQFANRELQKEIQDRQKASQALAVILKRTRELYRISQTIGMVRTPGELLSLLLSSSYLKDVSRASIVILDKPWVENENPPGSCYVLAEWNRGARQPRFIDRKLTLEEYGITLPIPYGQPVVIQDIQSVPQLPESARKRFAALRTHSLIILPLIAGGEWYGLLSFHFNTRRMTNLDDLRHVRGLVDETAIVIKNMRLLEAESLARHEAELANDLKLKFLAMISHELRTPLTSIKGFATTLLADDVVWAADKQQDFLQIINRESDKLGDLIEQLLDLTRMEAGVMRIAPKKVSLNTVISTALVQLQALTTGQVLGLSIPSDLPFILCDAQRIAQVLTNLVGNAAKFSPVGTKITISARRAEAMVQIDVADQGPGIPSKDRIRVFESFRQLENGTGSRMGGAGLGLAICKGLIEAHQGEIWVQDHIGPGTVISFTLPVYGELIVNDSLEY